MAASSRRSFPTSEGSVTVHDQCERHPSEILSFYCRACREAACRDCIAFDRRHCQPPCDYSPIDEAARICREDLRSLTRRLDDRKAELKEAVEGELETRLREGRAKYEASVLDFYDGLTQELEKKKDKVIQQVRRGSESILAELQAWQKQSHDSVSQIERIQESLESLSDKQLLAQRDTLLVQAEDLALKAIPEAGIQASAPEIVPVETIMAKLGSDLPEYVQVDPNQCIIQVKKEVEVNSTAHVYITLRDSAGFPCSVEQKVSVKAVPFNSSAGSMSLPARVTTLSSSRYLASFTPSQSTRGHRKLTVEVNQQRIDNDAISVLVHCPPQHMKRQIQTIDNIMHRGCLKVVGDRVICHTTSNSEPQVVYIDGRAVTLAYKLKLPPQCHLRQWGPDEIATGNSFLYVSDAHNHKIHCFNMDSGVYVGSTGSKGSEQGKFNRPNGLCFAQDNCLYVCDSENHRIQVFDQDLNFTSSFGEVGTDRCCFLWPSNVASCSEDGNVLLYVSELHNHRVQCVTTTGDHVRFIGSPGIRESQLSRPNILHIHRSSLFVSDDRGVVVFTLSGEFVTRFATELCKVGNYPIEGLAVSSDGFVYVYHCPQNRIFLY